MSTQIEIHTEEHALVPDHDGVTFTVYLDGRKVQCIITGEALKSQFNSADKPIMDIFTDNEETIASLTSFILVTRPERVNGTVFIRPEDLMDFAARGTA